MVPGPTPPVAEPCWAKVRHLGLTKKKKKNLQPPGYTIADFSMGSDSNSFLLWSHTVLLEHLGLHTGSLNK